MKNQGVSCLIVHQGEDVEELGLTVDEVGLYAHSAPAMSGWGGAVSVLIGAIIVEATKELVKILLDWLKQRKKSKTSLELYYAGDIFKLNTRDMKILANILETTSKEKEKRRKRRKKANVKTMKK